MKMSDLTNVLPEGTYNVRVHKVEYRPFPKSQNAHPYYHVWLIITGPEEQFIGRIVFSNYPLGGNGQHRLYELLDVTNHPADFEFDPEQLADKLLGLELSVIVMMEESTDGYPAKAVVKKHQKFLPD